MWLRLRWVAIAVILTTCGNRSLSIEGFDSQAWKNDPNGCHNTRGAQVQNLLNQQQSILGNDELDIVHTLGKPDQTELYSRNQKFYYYCIEPSPDCETSATTGSRRLEIRFNAVGLASEINLVD